MCNVSGSGEHVLLPPSQFSMFRLEMQKYSENAFCVIPDAMRRYLIVYMVLPFWMVGVIDRILYFFLSACGNCPARVRLSFPDTLQAPLGSWHSAYFATVCAGTH